MEIKWTEGQYNVQDNAVVAHQYPEHYTVLLSILFP